MAVDFGGTLSAITEGAKGVGFVGVGVVAWLAVVLIFGVISGAIAWIYLRKKKFKYKIIVWKKIGGNWKPALKDKAFEMKQGKDGTTIFYLGKLKKIIARPSLQVDDNTFYFFERSDGEWINFVPADFDEISQSMGAHFLDKEVRHVRLALERNMSERLEKRPSWLAQHWTVVAGIAFITMLGIMVFLLFDKWIELAGTVNAAVETGRVIMEQSGQYLSALDNICNGGSGIAPAA